MKNLIIELRLILFCLLCPIITLAQSGTITGKVIQADTKAPVRANVFLSNSSFGTSSAADGTFTLSGLKPGQYTLVANAIGYQEHTETVLVNNEQVNLNIELARKSILLKEVSIYTSTKAEWNLYYQQFKTEFIGIDKNAGDCKIINPEIINFSYHKVKKELDASTDDFLIVENKALGYRIKFLIEKFVNDGITGTTDYVGTPLFEELPGSESQKKKWKKKRDEAYCGSAMHFYRSLLKDSLAAEGFEMYHLTRQLNPRPEPALPMPGRNIIREVNLRPLYINQSIDKNQWLLADVLRPTDKPGVIYALSFPDCLYVVYKNKWEETYFKDVYRPADMLNYQITIVSFPGKVIYALFDKNGAVLGDSPLYEGSWSQARLSELLPVDYTPGGRSK